MGNNTVIFQANLGELETPQQQRSVISANMALIQVRDFLFQTSTTLGC